MNAVLGGLVLGVCAAMATGLVVAGWVVVGDLMWHKTRE